MIRKLTIPEKLANGLREQYTLRVEKRILKALSSEQLKNILETATVELEARKIAEQIKSTCPSCKGKGKFVGETKYYPCPRCDGEGRLS